MKMGSKSRDGPHRWGARTSTIKLGITWRHANGDAPRHAMDSVYLDHAATTPLREEVVEAMRPYAREVFGNPSSLHGRGRDAHAAREEARADVADALGARPSEIVFVRGGTESDNLAVLGSARARRQEPGAAAPLAVSAVEHSAVLEAARHARACGEAELTEVAVADDGSVDLDTLEEVASRGGATLSVMWVNNETGLVLPVEAVAQMGLRHGAVVHTDACQAVGKVPVALDRVPVDLLTATGHKLNGPTGVGILFVRSGTELAPLLHGGGQERGLRPGTEDVAGAVGFATALRLAVEEREEEARRLEALRSRFEAALTSTLPAVRINGGEGTRSPHVSSVGIPDVPDGQALLMALDLEGIAVSGGSACHSGAGTGSHVIAALYGDDDPLATVRFSFGRGTTEADVDRAVTVTERVVARLGGAEDAA